MNSSIENLLKLALQAHIWHFTTTSGYHHGVFGELYDYAHKAADRLVEPKRGVSFGDELAVEFPAVDQAVKELLRIVKDLREDRYLASEWEQNVLTEIERDLLNFVFRLEQFK